MSEPRSNRLRRALLGSPGEDLSPTRGGVGSDLKWAGGLPIMGTSNRAAPGQLGAGRQGGGGPIGAAIPSISESGSGCPLNSSNESALDAGRRFGVDSHSQPLTAQSPSPRTTKHVKPFELAPGHGFSSSEED
jgi:hypothetical protein